jgi:G3E family GTPase
LIRSESDDGTVIGLSNGCICCSISDDLSKALDALREMPVKHVILETSGVAEPLRVWRHCHYPGFIPKAAVVLVDASNHAKRSQDKYVGSLVRAQVEQAHLLVLSKTDLNQGFELNRLTPQLSNQDPDLIDTLLEWRHIDETSEIASSSPLQPAFRTYTWHQAQDITQALLTDVLSSLDESVHRVKGLVATEDAGLLLINRVGDSLNMRCYGQSAQPEHLGLVFICRSSRSHEMHSAASGLGTSSIASQIARLDAGN